LPTATKLRCRSAAVTAILPLQGDPLSLILFNIVVDMLAILATDSETQYWKTLSSWKGKYLSFGGRLQA
ncbi:hypothetical protein ACJX0J_023297, partial [Zea mays]